MEGRKGERRRPSPDTAESMIKEDEEEEEEKRKRRRKKNNEREKKREAASRPLKIILSRMQFGVINFGA